MTYDNFRKLKKYDYIYIRHRNSVYQLDGELIKPATRHNYIMVGSELFDYRDVKQITAVDYWTFKVNETKAIIEKQEELLKFYKQQLNDTKNCI